MIESNHSDGIAAFVLSEDSASNPPSQPATTDSTAMIAAASGNVP